MQALPLFRYTALRPQLRDKGSRGRGAVQSWRLTLAFLFSLFTFYFSHPSTAQAQAFGDWQDGTIILYNGDTLSGKLFLNQESDLMEVELGGTIKTYTALQVILVRFYDPPRLFASHPAALRGTMEVPSFFEVLYPGAYATLLSRDKIGMNNAPVVDQYGQVLSGFYGQGMRKDFYLLNARGKVRRLPTRRQDLARALDPAPPDDLLSYIKRHKPDPGSQEDLVALIAFYNHFRSGQPGVK